MCQWNYYQIWWGWDVREVFLLSKYKQLPYKHTWARSLCCLENIHVDLSGIIWHKGLNSESYYILFCEDFSSYQHIYPLKSKEKMEVFVVFKCYIAMVERKTGEKVKQFTLDWGGEFINDTLGAELKDLEIVLHATAGHTPQQKRVCWAWKPDHHHQSQINDDQVWCAPLVLVLGLWCRGVSYKPINYNCGQRQ